MPIVKEFEGVLPELCPTVRLSNSLLWGFSVCGLCELRHGNTKCRRYALKGFLRWATDVTAFDVADRYKADASGRAGRPKGEATLLSPRSDDLS